MKSYIYFHHPKPFEVSEKPAEPGAEEPTDVPKEAPDVSWGSDLGMLGMRCAIVLECMLRSYRGTI